MMNRILQGLNTSEYSTLQLCILVAAQLPSKSIRDVAARLTLLRVQIDPRSLSHKHARFRTFFVMILIVFVSRASIKLKRIPRYLAFDLALNTNLIIILSKMFVFSFQTTCVCVCVCVKRTRIQTLPHWLLLRWVPPRRWQECPCQESEWCPQKTVVVEVHGETLQLCSLDLIA
jgi:hypothetical protein